MAVAATAAMTGAMVAPAPAQAHHNYRHDIYRGGCHYQARGSEYYAATQKISGGCAGHAWVRIRIGGGTLVNWEHDPDYIIMYVQSGKDILWAEHKTQSNETPLRVWH